MARFALSEDQFRFNDELSMTNRGVKMNTSLQYSGEEYYILELHCYRLEENGTENRLGIYLKRARDTYFRQDAHRVAAAVLSRTSLPRPLFLSSVADATVASSLIANEWSQRLYIQLPEITPKFRVDDVRGVPQAFWHDNERYFSI